MEDVLKGFKFTTVDKWIFIDPPKITPRASLYSFSDYARFFLPTNADIVVVNESGDCTIPQIIGLVDYAKKRKAKLILSGEGANRYNDQFVHYDLCNEFVYAIEMGIGTITNPNEVYVPQPWFRMQQGWSKYRKKMEYMPQNKKFLSTMRCKNNHQPLKMLLYQELERLGILEKFMWTSVFHEPSLETATPKYFPSEIGYKGVNAELPSTEQTQSYTHTVIETGQFYTATEKIWQAFAFSQPIYWWSINNYYKIVEEFGFITEFDGIDQSYTQVNDPIHRCKLLALELKKLVDHPDLAVDLYVKNKAIAEHNHNLFFDENKCKQSGIKALQSIIDI